MSRAAHTAALLRYVPRARRRRLPRQHRPRPIEREYALQCIAFVQLARAAAAPLLEVLPALLASAIAERNRLDADEGRRVRELANQAQDRLKSALDQADIERLARDFAERTSTFQRIQLNRQVKAALGADVFIADRRLPAIVDGFVSENVALIKDLPARVLTQIEQAVTRAVASGTPHPELAKEIDERFAVGRDRARLIARDQVGKLYGQINVARQKEMGADSFVWRTVHDERVRPEHQERDGQTYRYSDPPDGELPGEPINCRCYAEPVFSAITEALDR